MTAFLRHLRSRIGGLFWGRQVTTGGLRTWMHEPLVRQRINASIAGSEDIWPTDWLRDQLGGRTLAQGVSLGCGDGALERDLVRKGICKRIVGIDISTRAIEKATRLAAEEGLEGITYRRADLNTADLGDQVFDGAFFHQSLHHVEDLEHCLRAVERALRPGSPVYLDEYVGPSRSEWRREVLADAEAVFQSLPREVRRRSRLQLPVDWRDPTEAIRSSEIVAAVESTFDVVARRDYGGNFLSVIYPHLDLRSVEPSHRLELIDFLLDAEADHLRIGHESYYVVILARVRERPESELRD